MNKPKRTAFTSILSANLYVAVLFFAFGAKAQKTQLLNEPVDISPDFHDFTNTYYLADSLADFDPKTATGHVKWLRAKYEKRMAFDNELAMLQPGQGNVFPQIEYPINPVLPFSIEFVSDRTVRIHMLTGLEAKQERDTLMLVKQPPYQDHSWKYAKIPGGYRYTSPHGSVTITTYPWHVEFRDADGRLLTSTNHFKDNQGTYTPVVLLICAPFFGLFPKRGRSVFAVAPGKNIWLWGIFYPVQ